MTVHGDGTRSLLVDAVERASSNEAFWASTPRWQPGTARADIGSEPVVWSEAGLFGMDPVAAALVQHLDGELRLADLALDLASAADAPASWARSFLATVIIELVSLRAIEGVDLPESLGVLPVPAAPSAPASPIDRPLGASVEIDPESGEAIRVVTEVNADGNLMTVEHLPDGRVRTSTTIAVAAPSSARGPVEGPSEAELAPLDSCVGSKLRNVDHVPLVSIRGEGGEILSVRCHSPEVAELLRARAGDRLTSQRGPIEAFVVTPLEGEGPLRIYDGLAQRRGRPRSPEEAAEIVDQILGERSVHLHRSRSDLSADVPDLLGLVAIAGPGGESALVPLDALHDRLARRELRRAGTTLSWVSAQISPDGSVASPSALGHPVVVAHRPHVVVPHGPDLLAPQRVHALVGDRADEVDRQTLLERAARLSSDARWRSLEPQWSTQLAHVLSSLVETR